MSTNRVVKLEILFNANFAIVILFFLYYTNECVGSNESKIRKEN